MTPPKFFLSGSKVESGVFLQRFSNQSNCVYSVDHNLHVDWSDVAITIAIQIVCATVVARRKASIVIYVDVEKVKSKVEINTKGMPWDKIKLANANAKKAMKAPASDSVSNSNAPQRITKPKRGIASLEKLTWMASVTIDGKKTPLTEIFAYEFIAYGKWSTHIVATAQPVKQDALLKLLQSNVPEEKWGDQWKLPSPNVVLLLDDDDSLLFPRRPFVRLRSRNH